MKKIIATTLSVIALSACGPSPYETLDCGGTKIFIDWNNKTVKQDYSIHDARFIAKDREVEWEHYGTNVSVSNIGSARYFWDGVEWIKCKKQRQ